MHDAIRSMLDRYECRSRDDYVNALREILQDVALLGLWRSKFFEHAAFYGHGIFSGGSYLESCRSDSQGTCACYTPKCSTSYFLKRNYLA